ncbi:hypothetical protein [Streptomyces avicenniae]|uniref:hypothetical protein n=1 Tax=Streptomyces avicenniae TaxID=500153 RepID=UPI000699AEBC|nr:hypothetical protein [Streptomyces avicenniae]
MGAGEITFRGLYNARLDLLGQVTDGWDERVLRLDESRETAESMVGQARSAVWEGQNAAVTLPIIETYYEEFLAAQRQAVTLRELARDAHARLRALHGELSDIVESAASQGVHVNPLGLATPGGEVSVQEEAAREAGRARAEEVQAQIDAVVRRANEADDVIAQALRDACGTDPDAFAGVTYDSLDEAAQAFEDAAWLTGALSGPPADLTAEERERIAQLLRRHGDDPAFAERLATGVGAEGIADFWAGLTGAASAGGVPDDEYAQMAAIQAGLGTVLGLATHSESREMIAWEAELMALRDQPLDPALPDSPHGFQVISSLMHHGEWDDDLLIRYGDELRRWEGENGTGHWNSEYPVRLVYGGDPADVGLDPATGLMEALGHNPDAALTYLGDTGNWEYFVEQRDWPAAHASAATEGAGYASLGHAMEAATLGHAWDDPTTPTERSPERTDLFERVVSYYGGEFDPDGTTRVDHHAALTGSLGRIGAEYMPDIQASMAYLENAPLPEYRATLDDRDVGAFLFLLGRDPDAYGSLVVGQETYGAVAMDSLLGAGGSLDDVENSAHANGQIAGILGSARADAVLDQGLAADAEFNASLAQRTEWANRLIGDAAGLIPYGGTVASWVAEDLIAEYSRSEEQNTSGTTTYEAYSQQNVGSGRAEDAAAATFRMAASAQEFPGGDVSTWSDTVRRATATGFSVGATDIRILLNMP